MTNRNFILLIIILAIIVLGFFGFLYFKRDTIPPGESTGGTNFLSQFNPFASTSVKPPTTEPPADISGTEPPLTETGLQLLKVSSMPIAGYTVYMKERYEEITPPQPLPLSGEGEEDSDQTPVPPETELAPALRYVARATGNIYQTFADKIEERKFSATVIPKVYEALFDGSGETVIMRYLKGNGQTIETFVGKLPKEVLGGDSTAENEIKGTFLPANVKDLSISPDGKNAFYLFETGENMIGTILNFATDKKTQIFDSAFNEWLSFWPNSKMITLTTKPSYLAPGYLYKLDPGTKSFIQALGEITGLTTLASPDGKMALVANNTLALSIYRLDTKTSEPLGVRTLPEKCVWTKASSVIYCAAPRLVNGTNYPDIWYQGEISFEDQIWKISVETGSASIILDPAATGVREEVDGIKLVVDEGENYLFFVNKKDSFLWRVELK